jgi:prophage maintenance system killer protein
MQVFLAINGYRLQISSKEAENMMVSFEGDNGAIKIGKVLEEKVKIFY